MSSPTRLSQEVARIVVTHQKTSKDVAILKWAKEMHCKKHGWPPVDSHWTDCTWCKMPAEYEGSPPCRSCDKEFPCYGPFCIPFTMDSYKAVCVVCGDGNMCPRCIDARGCINCGKICCKKCAIVCNYPQVTPHDDDDNPLTICNEQCARKTAKRARE